MATEALFEFAVKALSRRALTEAELRGRLESRAGEPRDVDVVLDRLARAGYLDDTRVAESHSRFRRDYEALGPERILRDLRRRGVESSVAEKAVAKTYENSDESELIRRRLRLRLGAGYLEQSIDDPQRVRSLYAMLRRAGFPSAKIVTALSEIVADSEWLEALEESDDSPQDLDSES